MRIEFNSSRWRKDRYPHPLQLGMTTDDPVESVIARHLQQLAPIFKANGDVIFALEAGVLGGTG